MATVEGIASRQLQRHNLLLPVTWVLLPPESVALACKTFRYAQNSILALTLIKLRHWSRTQPFANKCTDWRLTLRAQHKSSDLSHCASAGWQHPGDTLPNWYNQHTHTILLTLQNTRDDTQQKLMFLHSFLTLSSFLLFSSEGGPTATCTSSVFVTSHVYLIS